MPWLGIACYWVGLMWFLGQWESGLVMAALSMLGIAWAASKDHLRVRRG